jgi:hypothetical protein
MSLAKNDILRRVNPMETCPGRRRKAATTAAAGMVRQCRFETDA